MSIRYGIAAAAVLAAMTAGQAFAGVESAYVGAAGGVNFVPDMKDSATGSKIDPDTGWVAGGTLGLRWTGDFRTELEAFHRENDFGLTSALIPGTTFDGRVHSTSVILNFLKDFPIEGWKIIPYVGVGAGGIDAKFDALGISDSQWGGVYQGIVGATLPFTDTLEGFADYHYFRTFDLDEPGGDDHYQGHEIMLGLRWTFWQKPKPVAAAPAPAPVAAPKDYVVYFEFDKSNITKAAGAVLDELKTSSGGSAVSVVGHTDTSGSSEYNQKLSERRAKNTATALETRSVKVNSVTGRGFTEPAVNTGPGVKEPLNRRAVIKLEGPAAPTQ